MLAHQFFVRKPTHKSSDWNHVSAVFPPFPNCDQQAWAVAEQGRRGWNRGICSFWMWCSQSLEPRGQGSGVRRRGQESCECVRQVAVSEGNICRSMMMVSFYKRKRRQASECMPTPRRSRGGWMLLVAIFFGLKCPSLLER